MKNIVLLASGSGSNVENIVNFFRNKPEVNVAKVLTNNPEAFVIQRCKQLEVPCEVFTRDDLMNTDKVLKELVSSQVDLVVLAGFLWLIPAKLVDAFPNRIINIHPALLPKYGGKGMYGQHVHQAVVDNQEKESGITIHYVNQKYDEGATIFQATCAVLPEDSAEDVAIKVHKLEYEYFPKVIEQVLTGLK
jgi:phosphoribosylglycinamide formyltransferase-1